MKGPLRVRTSQEGVQLTIGPVWAEVSKAEAIEMWKTMGRELGILCNDHSLEPKPTPAAKCKRCGQLVELAKTP